MKNLSKPPRPNLLLGSRGTAHLLVIHLPQDMLLLGDIISTATVSKHSIHLLESLASCLRHAEPDEGEGEKAEDRKEHIGSEAGGLDEWRCDETDDEVVDPVFKALVSL